MMLPPRGWGGGGGWRDWAQRGTPSPDLAGLRARRERILISSSTGRGKKQNESEAGPGFLGQEPAKLRQDTEPCVTQAVL